LKTKEFRMKLTKRRLFLGLLVEGLAFAQTPQIPTNTPKYPLANSQVVTMTGTFQPAHAMMMMPTAAAIAKGTPASAAPVQIPDTCITTHSLPVGGPRALEVRLQSPPVKTANGGCQVQLEVGEPPESVLPPMLTAPPARNVDNNGQPLTGTPAKITADVGDPTTCGYSLGWVTDPVGIWTTSEEVNECWGYTNVFQCVVPINYSVNVPGAYSGVLVLLCYKLLMPKRLAGGIF
jgi:hypothetical protein